MLDTSGTLARFEELLFRAGFDRDRPDPMIAWRAFKDFARMAVQCSHDALLFQTGVYAFTGPRTFQLDFTRQFELSDGDEYAGMEQLHCTFHYPPAADLAALETHLWSTDCATLDEFFERVEGLPEFRSSMALAQPVRVEIFQETV